jgi:nitrate/nitrite transporter NarK
VSSVLRAAATLLVCVILNACSIASAGRGVDPRDPGGANGAVAGSGNMGVPGAVSLISAPQVIDWLSKTFMPDKHSDVPPPPTTVQASGERALAAQDCTNPAHPSAATLPCQ